MRLFYALTFDTDTKTRITHYQEQLASHAIKGRLTRESNYHVTLEFIGEATPTEKKTLTEVLYQLDQCPQSIRVDHFGAFSVKGRQLVWLGVQQQAELMALQNRMRDRLNDMGFYAERRQYTPHITLGRNMTLRDKVHSLKAEMAELPVYSLALMESKRVGDVLVYEAIEEVFPA